MSRGERELRLLIRERRFDSLTPTQAPWFERQIAIRRLRRAFSSGTEFDLGPLTELTMHQQKMAPAGGGRRGSIGG